MAYVPIQTTPDVGISPTFAPMQNVQASPGAYGAPIFRQLEAQNELNIKLRAMDSDLAFSKQAASIESDYLSQTGRNAVDGLKPALEKISDLRQQFVDNAASPAERAMIEESLNYRIGRYASMFGVHAGQQMKAWQNQTISGSIQDTINTGMDDYLSPQKVSLNVERIKMLVAQNGSILGQPDEMVKAEQAKATGEYASALIRRAADTSPRTARTLMKAYMPLMDASHQAEMSIFLNNREYTDLMRSFSQSSHEIALSDKLRHDAQAANYAKLSASVLQGNMPEEKALSDMVLYQQITPEQRDAVMKHAAQMNVTAKPFQDKSSAQEYVNLNAAVMAGTARADDIARAHISGKISPQQAAVLSGTMAKIAEQPIPETTKTMFGSLVRQTIPNINALDSLPTQQAQALKNYRDMSMEWSRRVVLNGERPQEVYRDMLDKYQFPATHPENWPAPKYGQISSLQDIPKVYAATKAAFAAGQLKEDEYKAQAQMIRHYLDFYSAQPPGYKRPSRTQATVSGAGGEGE